MRFKSREWYDKRNECVQARQMKKKNQMIKLSQSNDIQYETINYHLPQEMV